MAYENVTPPVLPGFNYPYHVLVFDYGTKDTDWYQVHLYYSATAFTYNGSVATNTGTVFWRVYGKDSEAWTDAVELAVAPTLSPGLHDGVYQRIYTNHDILDGNGKVWLAADSVTPVGVTEKWLHSFKLGLSLGLCGKALPWKKEPVAWLYNGLKLPKMPDTSYPYQVLYYSPGIFGFCVYYYAISSPTPIATDDADSTKFTVDASAVVHQISIPVNDGDVWKEKRISSGSYSYLKWANYDIYSVADDSLYLAATDPIPVYE